MAPKPSKVLPQGTQSSGVGESEKKKKVLTSLGRIRILHGGAYINKIQAYSIINTNNMQKQE